MYKNERVANKILTDFAFRFTYIWWQ